MKPGWHCAVAALMATACATASTTPDAAVDGDPDASIGDSDAGTGGDSDAAAGTPDAAGAPDATPIPDASPPDAFVGCSDGVIVAPEICDDGNLTDADGCSSTCTVEPFYRCQGTPSTCARISILYAPAEPDDAAYRAAIAAITGGTVDYIDANASTPTLTTMNAYDCVYTWVNQAYADNVTLGNNLADYVDGGGNVVLGVFATYTSGNSLAGRIMTSGYNPVTSAAGSNHFLSSTYSGDGTTFIHDSVTTYECYYRDILTLQGTGVQDGSYADGEIAHAYRSDFRVVYSNGSGHATLDCTGDWARLVANSCAVGHMVNATP